MNVEATKERAFDFYPRRYTLRDPRGTALYEMARKMKWALQSSASPARYGDIIEGNRSNRQAAGDVLDALVSLQVNTTSDGPSSFELTFRLDPRSPLHTLFLLSAGAPLPLVRVVIVVTIKGTPQVIMDGVMTKHEVLPGDQPGKATLAAGPDEFYSTRPGASWGSGALAFRRAISARDSSSSSSSAAVRWPRTGNGFP